MSEENQRMRHRVGDVLLVLGVGYIGITLWSPLWPPYDLLIAVLVATIGTWIGDYRIFGSRPAAPYRDKDHEVSVGQRKGKE